MRQALLLGLSGLSAAVTAQTLSNISPSLTATSTDEPSKTSAPTVHTIAVGKGGFKFTPAEIKNVKKNDIVTFEFYPPDHHVIRADFGSACVPYEYTGKTASGAPKIGFDSGVKLFDDLGAVGEYNWNLTVNDTAPIFFYCGAPNSCIGELMVGAINPTDEQSLADQILSAKNADYQLLPGEKIPSEASETLSAPRATATGDPGYGEHHGSSHKLSAGAIAGIVVGGVVFLAICAALFFYVGRAKSLKEAVARNDEAQKHASMPPSGPDGYGAPGMAAAPGSPFSPNTSMYGVPPGYSQHVEGEQSMGGYYPSPEMHQGRFSAGPEMVKAPHQQTFAEMPSPDPNQGVFTHELEAAPKTPR